MVTSGGVGSGRSTLVGITHVCIFILGIFVCSSVRVHMLQEGCSENACDGRL